MSTHKVMYIVALICFILASINVVASVNLVALGLAFWVATLLF
jgi:hypothetical protein